MNIIQTALSNLRKKSDEIFAPIRQSQTVTNINRFLRQPVPTKLQPLARGLEAYQTSTNPLVQLPQQLVSGYVQGANLGLGQPLAIAPRTGAEKVTNILGSMGAYSNPYTASGRIVKTVSALTNPLLSKTMSKIGGKGTTPLTKFIIERGSAGIANVGQGLIMNPALGQANTLSSMAIDLGIGGIAGPRQFDINTSALTKTVKPQVELSSSEITRILKNADYFENGKIKMDPYRVPTDRAIAKEIVDVARKRYPQTFESGNITFQQAVKIARQVAEENHNYRIATKAFGDMPGMGLVSKTEPKHKIVAKTGRIVGAPAGMAGKEALQKFRSSLTKMAIEGEAGKDWYAKSGKYILDSFGGDVDKATKFSQLLAIYSPHSELSQNFERAVKAWNSFQVGEPIKGGGMGWMDKAADNLLNKNIAWEGRKTNSFYRNIVKVFNQTEGDAPVTIDLWMMRALGYKTEAPSPQQYEFAAKEITRVANKLGWDPEQAQAAIWIAKKASTEKLDINKMQLGGFADAVKKGYGQLSWEAAPSKTSGLFPELHSSPWEQKLEYHQAVDKMFYDKNGKDLVAELVGLPSGQKILAPGVFEGQLSPGTQFMIPMPKQTKVAGALDPNTKAMLDEYSAIRGLYSTQDAVAYHKPFFDARASAANGTEISVGKTISNEQAILLDKKLASAFGGDIGQVSTPEGVRLINFGGAAPTKAEYDKIKQIIREVFPNETTVRLRKFSTDGNYISNDWTKNTNGEDYRRILQSRRPDLLGRADALFSNKREAIIDKFSRKYGWTDNRAVKPGVNPFGSKYPLGATQAGLKKPQQLSSAAGMAAGLETYQDENGDWQVRFNPTKAALGVAGFAGVKAVQNKGIKQIDPLLDAAKKAEGVTLKTKTPAKQLSKLVQTPAAQAKQTLSATEQSLPGLRTTREQLPVSSAKILPQKQKLNVENLNLTQIQKEHIRTLQENVPLTVIGHKEVVQRAATAKPRVTQLTDAEQADMIARQLATRQSAVSAEKAFDAVKNSGASELEIKAAAEEVLKNSETATSYGTLAGRLLEAQKIMADELATPMQRVIATIQQAGVPKQKIIDAMVHVDFNDTAQVLAFYRKMVPPKFGEVLDEIRYTNMLSSVNTHINNIASNFFMTGVVRPITKTLAGQMDWVKSTLTKSERKYFASQGADYARGYWSNLPKAWGNFVEQMKTGGLQAKPDLSGRMPVFTKGLGKLYTTPLRLLEASDQFFKTLTMGGEMRAGMKLADAEKSAQYLLFRQEFDPTGKLGQNIVLRTFDKWNSFVQGARNLPGGKWIMPFLQTPTNILKQGIEFSPLGLVTVPGAREPIEQLSKVAVGSTVFLGAYGLAQSNLTTWGAPTNEKERDLFYAAGLQPYSVKIGDKWVSYSKLGPLSYPIAMAAAYKNVEERNPDQSKIEQLGNAAAGTLGFFADQSYVRSLGDFLESVQTGRGISLDSLSKQAANLAGQLVPYESFWGWLTRMIDPNYKKPTGFTQQIASTLPGLSESVPNRMTREGVPSQRDLPLVNAISPARVSIEKPNQLPLYNAQKAKIIQLGVENRAGKKLEGQAPGTSTVAGKVYQYVDDAGEVKKVDLSPIEAPTLTGNYELDKKLKSSYNSKITSQTTAIAKLYEAGQLDANTAEQMIRQLHSQKTSTGKKVTFKKPKKITLKKAKVAKAKVVKLKVPKVTKLKAIKFKKPKLQKLKRLKTKKIKT